MRIATIGRGNIGGGLAKLWRAAGHEVAEIGREGGDVAEAEAVLVAVPGGAIAEALSSVTGLEGKTTLDATNLWEGPRPPAGFDSNAEYVKSVTGGPTAKAFNINFAALIDQVAAAGAPPGNFWCGDEEARGTVEALCRDAGYEPICTGPLANASMQEAILPFVFAIVKDGGMGPYFYRFAPPEQF
jgi:8-hydroxy-5-deazaflavin:NADPH oxidoreductase